jgi:ketosteroid isomerase-like protein
MVVMSLGKPSAPEVPSVVTEYFAAKNRRDVPAMLSAFAPCATVRDENVEFVGSSRIHRWLEDITQKHRLTFEIVDVIPSPVATVAIVRASGNVPGSPFDLRYAFTLSGRTIDRLDIDLCTRGRI